MALWRPLLDNFRKALSTEEAQQTRNVPDYWSSNPSSLISDVSIDSLSLGTGSEIHKSFEPLLSSAQESLVIVTCFWARSPSLTILSRVLRKLSERGLSEGRKIKIRICFSSVSFWQKLLHTFSLSGRSWKPSEWATKLGLPGLSELQGLDLRIKSIFLLPFSVMHPKFTIIDGKQVLLPSCNVSWEDWFEGCVEMRGDVVNQFITFWSDFWSDQDEKDMLQGTLEPSNFSTGDTDQILAQTSVADKYRMGERLLCDMQDIRTIFLPSPHHVNPCFRPFPWQTAPPPPLTPLNAFLLSTFASVERKLYIQTPNLTAAPALDAILNAAERGIDVHIVTSEKLMILEQLITAGTTTSRCVKNLVVKYRAARSHLNSEQVTGRLLEEGGRQRLGRLQIEYYETMQNQWRDLADDMSATMPAEPVQSHLKLTIGDDELVILGSGNQDRASWYTSQELGVAFFSEELASTLQGMLRTTLEGRKKLVFDSSLH